MTPDVKLRETLLKHGFPNAARDINIPARDVDAALATWIGYPSSMGKYPTKLSGKARL